MRSAQYDHRFEAQLQSFQPDFWRHDEFMQGVEWVLCRDPMRGFQTAESSSVWVFPAQGNNGVPDCAIYYAFNMNYVFFLSIVATNLADLQDAG